MLSTVMRVTVHCSADVVSHPFGDVAATAGAGRAPLEQATDAHNMNHGTINFPFKSQRGRYHKHYMMS